MGCSKAAADSCQFVRLAYCAEEQGKFWQADRWLFAYASVHEDPALSRMARDLQIDESRLRACVTRDDIYARADNESRLARKKLIPGTPYYIVGEKRLPPEKLESVLSGL
jgi:protein-disulfide isomerase